MATLKEITRKYLDSSNAVERNEYVAQMRQALGTDDLDTEIDPEKVRERIKKIEQLRWKSS